MAYGSFLARLRCFIRLRNGKAAGHHRNFAGPLPGLQGSSAPTAQRMLNLTRLLWAREPREVIFPEA